MSCNGASRHDCKGGVTCIEAYFTHSLSGEEYMSPKRC